MPNTETSLLPFSTLAPPPASRRPITAPGLSPAAAPTAPGMVAFVALSKFVVANGLTADVKAAFRARPHLVDDAPGYLRMEVISPRERPGEIWLLTFWAEEASFRAWHHSHLYQASHKGIPRGLKLAPGETQIRVFEHVAS